jgi:ABC-type uncharacterized transport system substrate-binding protein
LRGLTQTASKVYRVGLLSTGPPLTANNAFGAAILHGFASYGYVPDRNLVLEIHGAETHPEHLPELANDLVANKADAILTLSYPAAMAAKNATTAIPIVATESGGDPVATGLVKSLSRPETRAGQRGDLDISRCVQHCRSHINLDAQSIDFDEPAVRHIRVAEKLLVPSPNPQSTPPWG